MVPGPDPAAGLRRALFLCIDFRFFFNVLFPGDIFDALGESVEELVSF